MKIYEWTLFPTSATVAGWGSFTKTSLRNAVSHEVSDSRIIYDNLGSRPASENQGPAPHKVLITYRNVPGQMHWGLSSFENSPHQKTHKFCRIYCFSLNFYDYVQFQET